MRRSSTQDRKRRSRNAQLKKTTAGRARGARKARRGARSAKCKARSAKAERKAQGGAQSAKAERKVQSAKSERKAPDAILAREARSPRSAVRKRQATHRAHRSPSHRRALHPNAVGDSESPNTVTKVADAAGVRDARRRALRFSPSSARGRKIQGPFTTKARCTRARRAVDPLRRSRTRSPCVEDSARPPRCGWTQR